MEAIHRLLGAVAAGKATNRHGAIALVETILTGPPHAAESSLQSPTRRSSDLYEAVEKWLSGPQANPLEDREDFVRTFQDDAKRGQVRQVLAYNDRARMIRGAKFSAGLTA